MGRWAGRPDSRAGLEPSARRPAPRALALDDDRQHRLQRQRRGPVPMTAGSGTVVVTGDPLVMIDDFTNRAFFVTAPFATNALGTASGMPILWAVEDQGAAGSESFTVDDDFPTGGWEGVGWTIPPIGAGLGQFVLGA